MSHLFETLAVPHQDVLTHQFLDQRVGASVQLSQETQAETLRTRNTCVWPRVETINIFLWISVKLDHLKDASSLASYLVERSLHTFAGVVGHVLEGPAQSAQTVVGSVARPVHQVGVGLLSYSQIKPVHQHKLLEEAHRVHMYHV